MTRPSHDHSRFAFRHQHDFPPSLPPCRSLRPLAMVSSPLISTLLFLALALTSAATNTPRNHVRANTHTHRGHVRPLAGIQPGFKKLHRRKTCKKIPVPDAPESSSSAQAVTQAASTTSTKPVEVVSVSTPAAEPKSSSTTEKTSSATQASTPSVSIDTPGPAATAASGSSHKFTLINKCSAAVHPVVASTACGYSPRCADASTAALPVVSSLGAGQTAVIQVPDKFVGRIFSQNGECGASGENCTMLEFNLDADSFYTPNSYDISNIQGFTQSISLGADGCDTVTCTSARCSCENAYPIGDESGCGADLPVKACGAGNVAFTVTFCP
ncbi:hypothetical protein FB45DRAFT_890625 [Roridomyces roridus]|uniref:Thaumatin-like protein n=1 Tax=Roridomyces roridus TaxID=1738132 RepID=A0AAD7FW19_9AGAR|nr:hypothetical protein FB45DRAFT_890625 [Roridomyces roridus]